MAEHQRTPTDIPRRERVSQRLDRTSTHRRSLPGKNLTVLTPSSGRQWATSTGTSAPGRWPRPVLEAPNRAGRGRRPALRGAGRRPTCPAQRAPPQTGPPKRRSSKSLMWHLRPRPARSNAEVGRALLCGLAGDDVPGFHSDRLAGRGGWWTAAARAGRGAQSRPSMPSSAATAASRAARMSDSVPAIHRRPNTPTEATCMRFTAAAFSALFAGHPYFGGRGRSRLHSHGGSAWS